MWAAECRMWRKQITRERIYETKNICEKVTKKTGFRGAEKERFTKQIVI